MQRHQLHVVHKSVASLLKFEMTNDQACE